MIKNQSAPNRMGSAGRTNGLVMIASLAGRLKRPYSLTVSHARVIEQRAK